MILCRVSEKLTGPAWRPRQGFCESGQVRLESILTQLVTSGAAARESAGVHTVRFDHVMVHKTNHPGALCPIFSVQKIAYRVHNIELSPLTHSPCSVETLAYTSG